ncbi:DUF3575 domain-containing protein [Flavobacterium sp.]|uniref:DUF3575 domain-containing protein n=1 Tax=Flavobacterium sp. TaxID=239 RepID=UPI0039E33575
MKKIIFIALLCAQLGHAQDSPSGLAGKHNEVRVDLLSLVALSKYNLSYERYLGEDWSLGLSVNYANNKRVNDDFDEGNRNTIPKYEITPFVRYKLSKSLSRFYFAEVFASANGGDFREITRFNENNVGYYDIEKSDYFDVAIGAGAGYKMYIKEQFAIELLVGFGVNTIDTDKSPDVFSRVGLSFGYRF